MIVHSFIECVLLLVNYQEANWNNQNRIPLCTMQKLCNPWPQDAVDDKIYTAQGELSWMNSWRKIPTWAVQGPAANSGGQWRKDDRNWGTCPLLKLFLGTAVSSWWRKTPGEMDFLIFLKLCPKKKLHFESQNVSFPLANLNLIFFFFTTDSTSVFWKH